MVEPIKAKLVLDVAGTGGAGGQSLFSGFANALESTFGDLDTQLIGDIGAILGGMTLALDAGFKVLKAGFQKLIQASPRLETSIQLLGKGIGLLLRPIGDVISFFVKPLAIALLRFAIPIYKLWRSFLESPQAEESLAQIDLGVGELFEGIIQLDFDKMKSGITNIFEGSIGLLDAFFGTLGENVSLSGIWDKFQTLIADIKSFMMEKLLEAWQWFVDNTKIGAWLQGAWDALTSLPERIQSLLDNLNFTTMAEKLTDALRSASPLLALMDTLLAEPVETQALTMDEIEEGDISTFEAIDGASERVAQFKADSDETFLDLAKKIGNVALEIVAMTNPLTGLAVQFGKLKAKSDADIGTAENDQGIIGSLLETISKFGESEVAVNSLIGRLDAVPRTITTTHYIKTVRI